VIVKKIFRYFLFVLGSISGTFLGMWLIRLLLRNLRERSASYDEIRIHARSGTLDGEGTTDAPPPLSNSPIKQPEEETKRSIDIEEAS